MYNWCESNQCWIDSIICDYSITCDNCKIQKTSYSILKRGVSFGG